MRTPAYILGAALLVAVGCEFVSVREDLVYQCATPAECEPPKTGTDAGATDSGVDAGTDAGVEEDAGFDAGQNAGDVDAGFDGGFDAGAEDAGVDAGEQDAGFDAGLPDAGEGMETLGSGLTDLTDLDVSATDVFVISGNIGGTIQRCPLTGCGTNATPLVTSIFATSLAVSGNTLFVTRDYRYVTSCDLSGGTCTLTTFWDMGANSYPSHLWIANSRVYWMYESGSSRLIATCPLTGCGGGYPKNVYAGTLLNNVALGGLVVDAQNAYVLSFSNGLFRIPLTDPDTANVTAATQLIGTPFSGNGLDLDGAKLRYAVQNTNRIIQCSTPDCLDSAIEKSTLNTPAGVRNDATYVYGVNRGTPNGTGGFVAGTATIWRYAK